MIHRFDINYKRIEIRTSITCIGNYFISITYGSLMDDRVGFFIGKTYHSRGSRPHNTQKITKIFKMIYRVLKSVTLKNNYTISINTITYFIGKHGCPGRRPYLTLKQFFILLK